MEEGDGGQGVQEEGWNPEKKWWVPVAREERAAQANPMGRRGAEARKRGRERGDAQLPEFFVSCYESSYHESRLSLKNALELKFNMGYFCAIVSPS